VPESQWQGSGGDYSLSWGGRVWTLKVDEAQPGLGSELDCGSARLLSLHGLAAVGRFEDQVFTASTLLSVERYRARVQATYAPRFWGGVIVRAAWSPSCSGAGVDLEVQASASSVGVLRKVEVMVQSQWQRRNSLELSTALGRDVLPRDTRSGALSYDGRERADDLPRLVTLAVADSPKPNFFTPPGCKDGLTYIEMFQPNDVARQIRLEPSEPQLPLLDSLAFRYGIFGHDFEKGVVFRARMRGYWAVAETPAHRVSSLYRQFLNEPPPLGP
jgi:hypothetical protein